MKLVITAFSERLVERGGSVPYGVMLVQLPVAEFNQCSSEVRVQWAALKKTILPTLMAGERIYTHCMAGLRRAPFPTAMIAGLLEGRSFDAQISHIRTLRPIEPDKMFRQKANKDMIKWAREETDPKRLPPLSIRLPVRLYRSDVANAAWHVLAPEEDGKPRQPACKWKQAASSVKAFFTNKTVFAYNIQEAVVYEQRWCRQCIEQLPASEQALLLIIQIFKFQDEMNHRSSNSR